MFLTYLAKDPHFFVYIVVTMVFSTVLHELAHGWAAIWQGDRTPIERGHMTADPRVHMGTLSLLMLVTVGISFGAMPVDPRRFRHRHGFAFVAAAGPSMNLLLAFVALTGLGIWSLAVADGAPISLEGDNLRGFLWTFGYCNIALCAFNLIPIPPLDGSTVLASVSGGYRRFIEGVRSPVVFLVAFMVVFTVLGSQGLHIYRLGASAAERYLQWLYSFAGR
ncbi:MAG TPA: site-2 protease family protein [Planctomycetota bacterium]|nr:site-2 protease family protein [Planctomycetota bacterium]